jgi:hypothetical protein
MTTNQTNSEIPADDEQQKLMFDENLNQVFREACQSAFLKVPELRSVVVVFDYYRNLNDMEGISKGLWLHAEGGKSKPADSVVGSLGATLQAAAHILDEQMQLYTVLTNQLTEVSRALMEKQNELKAREC